MSNGITTWSAISDDQAEGFSIPGSLPIEDNSNRVITGTLRTIGGQEVPGSVTHRITSSDLAPQTGGILATVQNNAGFTTNNITPESTVELPGMGRTTVKVAERLGYLQRVGDGLYVEGSNMGKGGKPSSEEAPQDGTQQGNQQAPAEDGPELFWGKNEQAYADLIDPIPQSVYDSMLGSAAASLVGDDDSAESMLPNLSNRLASAMGIDPAQAQAMVKAGAGMWQQQADQMAMEAGLDLDELPYFYEWAKENHRNDLQQAIQQHLFGRNTKGYAALVERYFDDHLPSEEALKRHNIPTKTQNGTTMVQLKGSWMSLESAVKARLL